MKLTLRRVLLAVLATGLVAWLGLLALQQYYAPEAEFALIEDGLYMGGLVEEAPPGVTAVLNLCEFPDQYECEVHVNKPIRDAAPAAEPRLACRAGRIRPDAEESGPNGLRALFPGRQP